MRRFAKRPPVERTRIRRHDLVQVISGEGTGKLRPAATEDAKVRGARGKVLTIDLETGRATVQGLRLVLKHQKASRDPAKPGGGRIEKEAPIPLCNLMLVCPGCDKATRIGIRMEKHEREGGASKTKRVRVCKKCGADIPERS